MSATGQRTTGWRGLLSRPGCYRLSQRLLGAPRFYRELVATHIRPRPGLRILDLGCGPAAILDYLPTTVDYLGVDLSPRYIAAALRRHPHRGRFYCLPLAQLPPAEAAGFDLVLGLGVLHHLADPQAAEFFHQAAGALNSGGRCLTVDPCLVSPQSAVARLLIGLDRGRHPRTPEQYAALAAGSFGRVSCQIRHDGLRLPYTHHIMECREGRP